MSMTTKLALYASVFGLFAGTALADNMITVSAAESTVQPKVIMYSSGGVGEESQELFEKIQNAYTLKVTAADSKGHYLGAVGMIVTDVKGNILINTTTDGPLFYAELEPGKYEVVAEHEGVTKRTHVTIPESKSMRSVTLHWPADPVDTTDPQVRG